MTHRYKSRTYDYHDGMSLDTALAAIKLGPFVLAPGGWLFGRRRFAFKTVAKMIASGAAIRTGNIVQAAKP